jgi:hypothetical protein
VRRDARLRRARCLGGCALALALGLALSGGAGAGEAPTLAVELVDFADYDGSVKPQIIAINAELEDLEKRLPGIEVLADLWPRGAFDYRLRFQNVESEEDSLALEATFSGPGFEVGLLAQYDDPCTEFHRRSGARCEAATVEQRAVGVVADLFDLTLNDRSRGLYRAFDVVLCKRRGKDHVRMQVASRSILDSYNVPHGWFWYRPEVVAGATAGGLPDPVEVLLRRRTLDHDGYVVFLCESGSIEALAPYCSDGEEAAAAEGGPGASDGPRIVLEHRYPGRHLLPPPVLPPAVGVNQAPAPSAEPW